MSEERKKNPPPKPHVSYYFQGNYQEKIEYEFPKQELFCSMEDPKLKPPI